MNILQEEVEKILSWYSTNQYDEMKKARDIYFTKTGRVDEDSDEYEARMNSFNDWFVFHYKKENGVSVLDNYITKNKVAEDIEKSLREANYSLFLFQKINFRKQVVVKDILHNNKFILSSKNGFLALVEDDLFIGHSAVYNEEHFLLNGLCTLPRDVLSKLKKESKRIRKLNNINEEEDFLLNIERLKQRSVHYGHINSEQIFNF